MAFEIFIFSGKTHAMKTTPTQRAPMEPIRFVVRGIPKPQPRPRAFAKNMGGGKWAARVYDAGTAEGWKSCIAEAARPHIPAEPWDCPVSLSITFLIPAPKGKRKRIGEHHVCKPDLDNLEKSVMDALTQVGVWRDDSLVCTKRTSKILSRPEESGAIIVIEATSTRAGFLPRGFR